jgi:hypothetical protein
VVVEEERRGGEINGGEQKEAPEPVAAGGDQANRGLGFAAGAQAKV